MHRKFFWAIQFVLLTAILSACTPQVGTMVSMVTDAKPKISAWETVAFTFEMPEGAEQIAHITARSDDESGPGDARARVTDKIKKASANIGANVFVITNVRRDSEATTVPAGAGGFVMMEVDVQVIEGVAVYLENCENCVLEDDGNSG